MRQPNPVPARAGQLSIDELTATAPADPTGPRFIIEEIFPSVDGGRFATKRVAGEAVNVWADILRDGHESIDVALLWRAEGEKNWHREPMAFLINDRWTGAFTPPAAGLYLFAIEAWTNTYATWRKEFLLKREAGQDVTLESREGRELIGELEVDDQSKRWVIESTQKAFDRNPDAEILLSDELRSAIAGCSPGRDVSRSAVIPLIADRPIARAGAWYEMIPRSQSTVPGQHGTFDDCIARIPEIAALGFDVLYFTPIHPIGMAHRKGRNNAPSAQADDPGSFYAIGGVEGGHDAIHPELGTIADFDRLIVVARAQNMEVALDIATQCSPDHPWLKEHPEWFKKRPDGTMKYAENPPKKYQDIVNPDFYCADRIALWEALRDVILFWVDHGVKIFRIDNPHTKPFPFWEWMIREVQLREPGVVFLAEAFTRPKIMKGLAKLGFTQSYTYFTWRTRKDEMQEYLSELTRFPERDYYRPNFFVTTPDILPYHLQTGELWMFKARVALAALLSSNYGIYNGYELLEHAPIPGKEEYLDSEKYEIKVRDWDKPGNIKPYIAWLNHTRRANPALLQTANLRFAQVDDPEVIGFLKESVDGENAVACAVTMAGGVPRTFWFHFGDMQIGPPGARTGVRALENLKTGERHWLEWGGIRLTIQPDDEPALLFRCLA